MAYTTPRTWVAGEYPTAAQFNANIRDNVSFLANPPACRVTNNATQSISSSTWTAITFNTEAFDTDTMHSTVTNTSRITINTAGLYVVSCGVAIAANSSGARAAGIRKNSSGGTGPTEGGSLIASAGSGVATYVTFAAVMKLAAADYIEVVAFQTSGGALNSTVVDGLPFFAVTWAGLG